MLKKLILIGYNCNQIRKIFKHYSICNYESEYLVQKIENIFNYLLSIGYTKEEVIKLTVKFPAIFGQKEESLKEKVDDLISLGYSDNQVLKMVKEHPQILSYSKTKMMEKINNLILLGYTKGEVLNMILDAPYILGLSFNNIKNKIDYYKIVGIEKHFTKSPKNLMQSVELSYARCEYFHTECDKKIDLNNCHILFYSKAFFTEKFHINNEILINRYKYKLFSNNLKTK